MNSTLPLANITIRENGDHLLLGKEIGMRILAIFGSVAFVGGLISNILTLSAILFLSHMQTVPNAYIANLEAIDLAYTVVGVSNMAWIGWSLKQFSLMSNKTYCKIWAWVTYSTTMSAPFALMVLTLNRYYTYAIKINESRRSHKVGLVRHARLIISMTWLIPFAFTFLAVPGWWGRFEYNKEALFCTFTKQTTSETFYNVLHHSVGFLTCLFTMLYCYPIILKQIRGQSHATRSERQRQREVKTTRMIFVICLLYVFTYLPYRLVAIFDSDFQYFWLYGICYGINSLNVLFNAVVYAAMNNAFRQAYKKLLICFCCRRKKSTQLKRGNHLNSGGTTNKKSCFSTPDVKIKKQPLIMVDPRTTPKNEESQDLSQKNIYAKNQSVPEQVI